MMTYRNAAGYLILAILIAALITIALSMAEPICTTVEITDTGTSIFLCTPTPAQAP